MEAEEDSVQVVLLLPSSTNALNGDFFVVSLDFVFDFHKATTVVSFIVMERDQNLIKCPPEYSHLFF